MTIGRSAGILLHPTSLPGPFGIGDLGEEAFRFVDFLQSSCMMRWQVLPLGPTGYADSPYASFSSFAGNPLLISPERLAEQGWIKSAELNPPVFSDPTRINYAEVLAWKFPLLRTAANRFLNNSDNPAFDLFCRDQGEWLEDYATFMAIKSAFDHRAEEAAVEGATWNNYWDLDIALRKPKALNHWKKQSAEEIAIQKVWQYWFHEQWMALKNHANQRGIRLIGDLPIFVAADSADVWADPQSFLLNDDGSPGFVAGVPPDYFSTTGQRWGNPLYNWAQMEQDGFAWWVRRFRGTCALYDIVRVDHFRGFEACWSIPASETTAVVGEWVPAPGQKLFQVVRRDLGELPLIAEDLGLITPEVDQLRESNGFPGMRILQFAFDSLEDRSQIFLPHNHVRNCVVYTGTHDNDTIRGWYETRSALEQQAVADYLGHPVNDVAWDFIRLAMSSVADTVIVPMQDVLGLGTESRMNTPSTMEGNWCWRLRADYAKVEIASRLAHLTFVYGRRPAH